MAIKIKRTMDIKKYFGIKELVCPHVYNVWGERAWKFFDSDLLEALLVIREGIGVPFVVNNWALGGSYSQRGLRCNCCALVKEKTSLEKVYLSQHIFGKAVDFTCSKPAEEVRQWIRAHAGDLPCAVRLEEGVSWVHLDTLIEPGQGQVQTFRV